jgi:hypothetical protein
MFLLVTILVCAALLFRRSDRPAGLKGPGITNWTRP